MSANVKVVNLQGEINLASLEEYGKQIVETMAETPMVLLSLSQATGIDLSGIQLLYAARRYAEKAGKSLHITGAVPDAIAQRLYRTGFVDQVIREGRELEEGLHGFTERTPVDA